MRSGSAVSMALAPPSAFAGSRTRYPAGSLRAVGVNIGHRYPKLIYNALMQSLKWSSSHAVFMAEIDDEHKQIFEAAAQFQAALSESAPARRLNQLAKCLAVRIEDHFAHEERLMKASRYGSSSWHRRSHDGARERVAKFIQRLGQHDQEAGPQLLEYLVQWLNHHTRLADRMLGAFLRNHRRTGKIVFTLSTRASDSCTWVNSRGERFDPSCARDGL